MKWLGSLLVVLSLGLFTIGCGGGTTEPAPDDEGPGAAAGDTGDDTGMDDTGMDDTGGEEAGGEEAGGEETPEE